MAKTSKIKAGYRITSVSWENDGDHYRTVVIEGVKEEEAKLIGSLGKLMQSRKSGLENNYEPSDEEYEKGHQCYLPTFEKYEHLFSKHDMNLYRQDCYAIMDYIGEKITGYSTEGYALRVLESMKVEYFPEDVVIEDVTKKFFK